MSGTLDTFRVMIADDHDQVRAGLRALLQLVPGVEVVAETANGLDAVRLAATERPDLVFLDVSMPKLGGLEAMEQIKRQHSGMRIVVLSMDASQASVRRALGAGASGYVLKESVARDLEAAIHAVARGEIYLSPQLTKGARSGDHEHG